MQSYKEILASAIAAANLPSRALDVGECQSPTGQRCSLCYAVRLSYADEARLKDEELQRVWKDWRFTAELARLVRSPLGRGYRTTTKRRVFPYRDTVCLGLIAPSEEGEMRPFPVVRCVIEPQEHCAIFHHVQESFVKPYAKKLARATSYVVIKGTSAEQTLIFNVKDISPELVRSANTLSKSLTRSFPSIIGIFLYADTSSPQYYLGRQRGRSRTSFRKLYGKSEVYHRVLGRSFLYSPLSFSQVNQSILERVIREAQALLQPKNDAKLYDLYCGYGLFALCLAGNVREVIGVESSSASIASAFANARRQRVNNARFLLSDINQETIGRIMTAAQPGDAVILDPPRKGTAEGVIEFIAATRPARVVHIFCAVDLMPKELKRWERAGYTVVCAVPFDMFPGTPEVEILVLLEPA